MSFVVMMFLIDDSMAAGIMLWTVSGADWSRFMQQVGTIVPVLVESQVKWGGGVSVIQSISG